jgi:hypothetical protein
MENSPPENKETIDQFKPPQEWIDEIASSQSIAVLLKCLIDLRGFDEDERAKNCLKSVTVLQT